MKNIYDERKERQLLFLLDKEQADRQCRPNKIRTAVIINLYYLDTVPQYVCHINNVPHGIPVYVYSPSGEVLECVKQNASKRDVFCIRKRNRGRDVSALLVAAAEIIPQYDVICFLHDKKARWEHLREEVNDWIRNLWGNMIASETYVVDVLDIFEKHPKIGLLVPPEPYGEYKSEWYGDGWGPSYEITKELANELNLNADVSNEKPVFVLSTVFWARTAALNKLFARKWTYEDFQEEPLPIDGTISHAIERILGYVAQDAGYQVGTVMNTDYASWLLLQVQDDMREMFSWFVRKKQVLNIHQAKNLDERERRIQEFVQMYPKIYIYGAGVFGKNMQAFLYSRGWNSKGFVVSQGKRKGAIVEGLKVFEIQEIVPDEETGILLGVGYEYRSEVEKTLEKCGFNNYLYGY